MERDDDLRRNIGTLWRTAMVGLGTVREVVVRSTQSGRLRVDIALLQRERSQLLETLGEGVLHLVKKGELEDLPAALRDLCDRILDTEDRLRSDTARAVDNAFGAPRGYEPEAATDYGVYDGDSEGEDDEDAPDETGSPQSTDTAQRSPPPRSAHPGTTRSAAGRSRKPAKKSAQSSAKSPAKNPDGTPRKKSSAKRKSPSNSP